MTNKLITEIEQAEKRATDKHGPMTEIFFKQVAILTEELGEASQAILDGDIAHYREEVLDIVGAAVRILEVV